MEKTSTLVNNIYANAREYISLKTRSVKFEVYDKAAGAVSGAVNGAIIAVLGLCAFMFLNVGVAYWLSEIFGSTKLGFLSLGGLYAVLLAVFFAFKGKISATVKNSVVAKVSKDQMNDYRLMIKEKDLVNAQLERAETVVKGNIEELKDNIDTLVEDFKKIKEDVQKFRNLFGHSDHNGEGHEADHSRQQPNQKSSGGMLPKLAVSTIVELIINRFVLKDVHSLKKVILPIIAKAFINAKIMKPSDGTSPPKTGGILDSLKSKLARFF
jgi:hypothetical protein